MVNELIDILLHRANGDTKDHPYLKDLSSEAKIGYRKACLDLAIELEHAIEYDEQTKLIIKLENIEKLKKEVNKLIIQDDRGKRGRHHTRYKE